MVSGATSPPRGAAAGVRAKGRLGEILAAKLDHVAASKAARPVASIEAALPTRPTRGFAAALAGRAAADGIALIAEIKRASPSKGLIRADFEPAALATAYAAGGAACLSVLTDRPYFQGHEDHLIAASTACSLPVLRKDFTLDPYQVAEARAIGADAVLLIVAALDDDLAAELEAAAVALGLDVLVEVHDERELERALRLRSPLIGVNNRDLRTFKVDLATTERLAALLPAERLLVAESGIATPADVARARSAGARACLVGESLMRQDDVAAATRRLLGAAVPAAM